MALRADMVDIFLETKDVLKSQLDAYRASEEPDEAVYKRICAVLRQLAEEDGAPAHAAASASGQASPVQETMYMPSVSHTGTSDKPTCVRIRDVGSKDAQSLLEEMGNLGRVLHSETKGGGLAVWVQTTCSVADIEAVCCFIVNADQLRITHEAVPASAGADVLAQFEAAASSFTSQEAPAPAAVHASAAPAADAAGSAARAQKARSQRSRRPISCSP